MGEKQWNVHGNFLEGGKEVLQHRFFFAFSLSFCRNDMVALRRAGVMPATENADPRTPHPSEHK